MTNVVKMKMSDDHADDVVLVVDFGDLVEVHAGVVDDCGKGRRGC